MCTRSDNISTSVCIHLFIFSMLTALLSFFFFFFFQAEDGIRIWSVTGVQTCALPISIAGGADGLLAEHISSCRHATSACSRCSTWPPVASTRASSVAVGPSPTCTTPQLLQLHLRPVSVDRKSTRLNSSH